MMLVAFSMLEIDHQIGNLDLKAVTNITRHQHRSILRNPAQHSEVSPTSRLSKTQIQSQATPFHRKFDRKKNLEYELNN